MCIQISEFSKGGELGGLKYCASDGVIRDGYIDISLPERITDDAYFLDGKSLAVGYSYEFEGDIICAVPINCFGTYELFYSKVDPNIGIEVLQEGQLMKPPPHISFTANSQLYIGIYIEILLKQQR